MECWNKKHNWHLINEEIVEHRDFITDILWGTQQKYTFMCAECGKKKEQYGQYKED